MRLPSGAAVLVLLLGFAGVGSLPGQEPSAAGQSVQAGAAVFGSRGCGTCHSISGAGGSIGPDLRTVSSTTDAIGITAALWNHLPEMGRRMDSLGVPRPSLSAREAGDLLAFLYAVGASEALGSAESGARQFRDRGCVRCHQVGGVGGVIGPALDRIPSLRSPSGLAAGLWNHAGGMIPRMREMGIPYPVFDSGDIGDLAALLRASADPGAAAQTDAPSWVLPGDENRGRALVEAGGCRSCHRVNGVGAGTAVELTSGTGRRTHDEFLAALWNKGPRMRAAFAARGEEPPRFEPGEMADLTAYLLSFGYFASSGDADRGRATLKSAGCLSCHGLGNPGRSAGDLAGRGPEPEMAGRIAGLWNHFEVAPKAVSDGLGWPVLSRAETADVLEYLGTGSK